jgi:hypothetical protein
MGKALMGTYVPSDSLRLMDEVRVLRQRVVELEAALDEARRVAEAREADDGDRGADVSDDDLTEPATAPSVGSEHVGSFEVSLDDRQPATT